MDNKMLNINEFMAFKKIVKHVNYFEIKKHGKYLSIKIK